MHFSMFRLIKSTGHYAVNRKKPGPVCEFTKTCNRIKATMKKYQKIKYVYIDPDYNP